ncbi:MAG: hypothetical protein HC925_02465 [Coleofasciculaceae cyanobacterium SM2_3_26]|nr:hypothetical protein [Coleofasciculaceae cyanobacterium SM2_3_26]
MSTLNSALSLLQALRAFPEQARALSSLGLAYASLGDAERSLVALNQALVIYQQLGNAAGIATTNNNIREVSQILSSPR